MAAEDAGKPPTHPRQRTPDHPPYAVMIGAAIQSLSEEGGSTMAAISRYIRTNYDDIPDGHDSLLPYYLAKLTALGEFVMIAPGRFAVADDAGAELAPASSRPGHAKPTSSLNPIVDEGDHPGTTRSPPPRSGEGPGSSKAIVMHRLQQLKPTAHEGDVVERIQSLPSVSGAETEGHARQPSDGETLHKPSGYVLALPWEGPPVSASPLLVDNYRVGSADLDRRKGRNDGKDQDETDNGEDDSNRCPNVARQLKKKAV